MTVPRNSISRRRLLGTAAAGAAASLLPGCGPATTDTHPRVSFRPGEPLPWINWAANQTCNPAVRAAPASEAELVDVLRNARGVVRAVGAGHSFSGVVPTDDTLISTDLLWSFLQAIVMSLAVMLVHTYYGYNASGGPVGVGHLAVAEVVGAVGGGVGHQYPPRAVVSKSRFGLLTSIWIVCRNITGM